MKKKKRGTPEKLLLWRAKGEKRIEWQKYHARQKITPNGTGHQGGGDATRKVIGTHHRTHPPSRIKSLKKKKLKFADP